MSTLTKEKWNKDSEIISIDRLPSVYAINIVSQIKLNRLICDVGSGNGVDSILFANSGSHSVLLDISDYALSKTKEIARRVNLEEKIETYAIDLDNENLNFQENYFDYVYSHLSLYYFDRKRTKELSKELYRVLKVGGIAFIALKSNDDQSEIEFLKRNAKEIDKDLFDENGI